MLSVNSRSGIEKQNMIEKAAQGVLEWTFDRWTRADRSEPKLEKFLW